jgi:Carboxypeptidase regulatory-like domain/TonB-dependent Receptor Plug Domain
MKRLKFPVLLAVLLFAGAGAWSPAARAQSGGTGALTVTVSDPSGGVIAGASVTISNGAAVTRTQTTAGNGSYTFTLLPPGSYKVSISAAGFQSIAVPAVTVDVTETEVLNQSLQVGAQTQQVTVSGSTESIQTETSALGGVVNQDSIVSIPLATRNYTQILNLSPGVITSVTDASTFGRGSQSIYVNGHDDASNSYLMDGVQVSSYSGSTTEDTAGSFYGSIPIPSPDSLQEFKVVTSMYDASIGRNPGASVSLISKTGSNSFHGNVFEFFRNDDLDANTFFAQLAGHPRGELKQNQYGGTFGGPIRKDKLFFFFSYQGTRQINGVASQGTSSVTLPGALTNDRSAAALGAEFCHAATFPAKTGVPNPASDQVACDGSNINPVSLQLLNAKLPDGTFVIPTPQIILASGAGFSYFSIGAPFHEEQASFNLDYVLSPKNTFSGRFFYSYAPNINEFTSSTQPPGAARKDINGDELISGKLTSLLSSNVVNEARFSSYYIRSTRYSLFPVTATDFDVTPASSTFPVMPVISITGAGFAFGGGTTDNEFTPVYSYEWADQLSWNRGRHTLRFGYDGQRNAMNICSCGKTRGQLTFQTFSDFLLGMSGAENGTTLSNIFTSNANVQLFSNPNLGRENNFNFFAQDDFKVSSRLTLNLGLRWEYDGTGYDNATDSGTNAIWSLLETVPITPVSGTFVGFTVKKDFKGTVPPGVTRRSNNLYTYGHAPLTNFAPRVGFAWQPLASGKFVVRGGSGIFYKLIDGQHFLDTWDGEPPVAAPFTHTGASNAAATFNVPFTPAIQIGSFNSFLRTPTSAISLVGVDPNLSTPTTFNWNLETQYAITPSLMFEIGYVGDRTEHTEATLVQDIPVLASPSDPVNCGAPFGCVTTNTSANAAQRLPVLGFGAGGFIETANVGFSSYNALQVTVRKTISKGLQFQAAYTWGKCLSDYLGTSTAASGEGGSIAYDPATQVAEGNRNIAKGECGYDRPQRLVVSYVYNFPRFNSGEGFAGHALSGWDIAGVTTVQSGNPITLTDSRGGQVYGAVGTSGANLCAGETIGDVFTHGSTESRISDYFNTAAFCAPPVIGVEGGVGGATGYGNVRMNPVLGPGQFNWDISIQKHTTVGGLRENADLEFRTDFFNAFNHTQFSNPASNVGSASTFGVITTTSVGPRIIQFALKYAF